MKFYFWQLKQNEHEAGWIRGIANLGMPVSVCVQREIDSERLGLGLGNVDYGNAEVIRLSVKDIDDFIRTRCSTNDLHFFMGIKEFELNKHAFAHLSPTNARLFYISESKDVRGIKGVLRFVRDFIIDRSISRRVQAVLAMGKLGTSWFQRIGFAKNKIIEYCYSVADPVHANNNEVMEGDKFRIVYAGQLIERKRVDTILVALAQLKKGNISCQVDIIGSGIENSKLIELSKSLGLSSFVTFSAPMKNDALRVFLQKIDLLLLPSAWDGWGAITNEALLAGCRVGVSKMCGSAVLCEALSQCFTFDCGDVQSIVNNLENQLALGRVTPAERQLRVQNSKEMIGEAAVADYLLKIVSYATNIDMEAKPQPPWYIKSRVTIAYHFFPHYRRAVFRKLLASRNFDFEFAASSDSAEIDASIKTCLPGNEARFINLPLFRLWGSLYWQPALISLCSRTQNNCVILLGDPNNVAVWIAALILRRRDIRVLFWAHGWIDREEPHVKRFIRNVFFRIPNGIMLYGRRAKLIAQECGFSAENLWVIYNSLDYDEQRAVRDKISAATRAGVRCSLFGSSEVPVVACISRLTSIRALDLLVKALAVLKRSGHERHLLLIGDGVARSKLENLAGTLDVKIHCAGEIYDEDIIGPLLSSAAVTVVPGKVGLTAMHSMAYGVPVLTHDDFDNQMPECEAIVPGLSGDFFKSNSVEDIAKCILKWTYFAEVSSNVRKNCIAVVERFYNPQSQSRIIESAVLDEKQSEINVGSIQPFEIL